MTDISKRIRDLAITLGADPVEVVQSVQFSQSGRMRDESSSKWMHFRAQQSTWTSTCQFVWTARTGPAGLIRVRDALIGENGRLDVNAFGFIPLARTEATVELTQGELMRYLAELPWNPDTILRNGALHWREDATNDLLVRAELKTASAEVKLYLDEHKGIIKASAPDRPRAINGRFIPTPWVGRFFDHEYRQGRIIPTRADVAWIVEGIETIYWEGRIEDWHIQ